jgi:hypothetical protein
MSFSSEIRPERLLASRAGVEVRVCVVYESQEGNDRLVRSSEALGMVLVVHPELLWSGVGHPALFLSQPTTQYTSGHPRAPSDTLCRWVTGS